MVFSIEEKLKCLEPELRNRVEARIEEVAKEQRARGMTPRDDSMLTWKYAEDTEGDPCLVADELVSVDLIYKLTPYGDILPDVMRRVAYAIKMQYKLEWGDTWRLVRAYVPTIVKIHCALRFGII